MKNLKFRYLSLFAIILLVTGSGCKKNSIDISRLYTPVSTDATATATLAELQQGRTLYINNCSICHALASPDDYSAAQWRNVIGTMAPRTSLSSSEIVLVTKYVTKGK